jgi:hypothetical protein
MIIMGQDNLQKQRYELKYVVPEQKALAIRDFLRCYLDVDKNGLGDPDLSYPVHSLYLDSPGMALYHSTINGDKNRFKLRIRFYNESDDTPVFLEIKRRMNNIISKKRVGIPRLAAQAVLSGQIPSTADLMSANKTISSKGSDNYITSSQEQALYEFSEHVNQLQAQPVSHVAYRREAWILPDTNAVRVTLDRQVRCEPDPDARLNTIMNNPTFVFGDWVILELKFTDRFPNWFRDLVEIFNLTQCGAAKYVDGVTLMGKDQVTDLVASHMDLQHGNVSGLKDHLKRREQAIAATF